MMISTRGRYALYVLLELAERDNGKYIPLKTIAEHQNLSLKYTERITSVLTQNGLLDGLCGKGGGYKLKRAPSEYTVGEILRLTEGSFAPVTCLEADSEPCGGAAGCRTLAMWKGLHKLVNDYFDGITLADLLKNGENT